MTWIALSESQKKEVIDYCNQALNKEKPDMFSETGEPIYLSSKLNMINISEVIEGVWAMGIHEKE